MKNIIIAWCNSNEKDFENHVPLNFVGNRNKRLGFSNDINVLFLDGYNFLSDSYKNQLKDLGYNLFDLFSLYSEFDKKYYQLDRFSAYEKKCFLRWLVIDKFFSGEKIIHYDGDIVFNEDPKVIAEKVTGKTFVLQGCPAFTVVSKRDWFNQYNEQLDLFVRDIEKYSSEAWQKRLGWEVTFKTRWAGSRFRKIISSDQDFLSHLMHTGRILQDPVESISLCLNDYVVFQNPLLIHFYDDNFPYTYKREKDIDYFTYTRVDGQNCFYKKRVLFWHMQSCFNFYLSKFILRKRLLRFLPLGRLNFRSGWEDKLNKKLIRFLNHNNRLNIYRYFFEENDFSGVLKNHIWWKTGVF